MKKLQHYQSKSITLLDDYEFTLSKELEELARDELSETEQLRNKSIEALREWIHEHPKIIKTRMDAVWLLRFLRFRKFDLPRAQEAFESYMVLAQSPLADNWFNDLNILRPSVEKLMDSGFICILPNRDKFGRRVVFYNAEIVDINSPTLGFDVLTLQTLTYETLLENEENQVRGIVHVGNVQGCGMRHFAVFSPQFLYQLSKNTEKTLAMRHKGIHVVNVPLSLKRLSNIVLSFLSHKLRSRIRIYSNFDQFTAIDKDNLPKEYGGKVPIKEMAALWKQEMLLYHKLRLDYVNMKIRTDMYPLKLKKYQAKSVTPVDDYVFTMSNELKEIAEIELRETDEIRTNAIRALRDWAISNPRFDKIRLDSNFLLQFLRHRKFSIPMAQDSLEKYLVLTNYCQEGIHPYIHIDLEIPSIQHLLKTGTIFALPKRDKHGRRVMFYRAATFDSSKHVYWEISKLFTYVYRSLSDDEENQIRGIVHIVDTTGFGLHFLTVYPTADVIRIYKNSEKIVPLRHKEIHGNNIPAAFKIIANFMLGLMSPKLRARVNIYSKMEEMTTVEKDILPKEYGGIVPMADMIDAYMKELRSYKERIAINDEMKINMEMYPEAVRVGKIRAMREPIDGEYNSNNKSSEINGIQGSFRKLEID
ncbi:unnamed protein product [Diamesa hyperborea]